MSVQKLNLFGPEKGASPAYCLTAAHIRSIRWAAMSSEHETWAYTRRGHPSPGPNGLNVAADVHSWLTVRGDSHDRGFTIPALHWIEAHGSLHNDLAGYRNPIGYRLATGQAPLASHEISMLQSLISIVQVGDLLRLHWKLGDRSPELARAGFSYDRVTLQILRPGARSIRYMAELPLDDRVFVVRNEVGFKNTVDIGELPS